MERTLRSWVSLNPSCGFLRVGWLGDSSALSWACRMCFLVYVGSASLGRWTDWQRGSYVAVGLAPFTLQGSKGGPFLSGWERALGAAHWLVDLWPCWPKAAAGDSQSQASAVVLPDEDFLKVLAKERSNLQGFFPRYLCWWLAGRDWTANSYVSHKAPV